jgi:hypothetical protein
MFVAEVGGVNSPILQLGDFKMNFDFNNMSNLAATNPAAFEVERKRLIAETLREVPEAQRMKCEALQAELDAARATMSPKKFMDHLLNRIQENIADMGDQFHAIQVILERDVDTKPVLAGLNKVAYTGRGFM